MSTDVLVRAEKCIKAGDWDHALEQLESLKKERPSQPEVYQRLAYVFAVKGRSRSVVSTYLELVEVLVKADELGRVDIQLQVPQMMALAISTNDA